MIEEYAFLIEDLGSVLGKADILIDMDYNVLSSRILISIPKKAIVDGHVTTCWHKGHPEEKETEETVEDLAYRVVNHESVHIALMKIKEDPCFEEALKGPVDSCGV